MKAIRFPYPPTASLTGKDVLLINEPGDDYY